MSEDNTNTETVENNEAQVEETTNHESEKTFSQSEVNSLLAENKRKLQAKYSDYDELKETATKLDEIKAQAFDDGKQTATNELVGRLVETEIRSTAQSLGFADPSDALTFFGDKSEITYDPGKGLDQESIKTRLDDLATNKPYLLSTKQVNGTTSRPQPKVTEAVIKQEEPADTIAAGLRTIFKH